MNVRGITNHRRSVPARLHSRLTHEQWLTLAEAFADMCVATEGAHEDLHDRAAGVLEAVSLPEWGERSLVATTHPLWSRIYQHFGNLAHLADATPDNAAEIRAVGQQLITLGQDMAQYQGGLASSEMPQRASRPYRGAPRRTRLAHPQRHRPCGTALHRRPCRRQLFLLPPASL